ncbi:hypothetical protein B0G93_11812 [Bacillus sp. V-88]|jgi:hypothetical protein|uniref:Uncharacterized protein n=1 Tax=Rossellomorea vietnamensis TaxID=218284 RepID=A0A6I6UTV1_9BACI|nr:hypothetical protein [Rossellomorea vietnamensis]OXS57139.1 hypothetical protein B1B00_15770 [Bacillus sp. DSM 27956]PRX73894.1 hypothetical protein B0G93_11812 [Bacillus sp. V-88]QHE62583.1 hypothetical protein FHE72_17305 [Rossellomorea vietnamensis]SLK23970.1 hypothetical protein SAMN06295884_11812 [Bacillus sp. V-88]
MANDKFTKALLIGILACLIVIAFKMNSSGYIQSPTPNVDVNNQGGRVVQIAPNRVGVIDTGIRSGWEQLVVFEYNPDTKTFEVVSSLAYEDIFNHPKEHGIPVRTDKYGN